MKKQKLTSLILLIFIISVTLLHYTYASTDVKTDIDALSGIQKTIFTTKYGNVIVMLPDDIEAGDSISGTILVEAIHGIDSNNLEKLYKYTVGINKQITSVSQKEEIKFNLPKSSTGGVTYLVLRDEKGEEVSRNYITYQNYVANFNAVNAPSPWEFQTPSLGRSGKYSLVNGPFDGNFGTTSVSIGQSSVTKIAESPRQMVFENPIDVLGDTELMILERGVEVRRKYQNIQVVKLNEGEDNLYDEANYPDSVNENEHSIAKTSLDVPADGPDIIKATEDTKGGFIQEDELDVDKTKNLLTSNENSIPPDELGHKPESDKTSPEESKITKSSESRNNNPGNNIPDTSVYTVQVASYKNEKDAQELLYKLESKGYDVKIIKAQIPEKGLWYRVRIGNFESKTLADSYASKLKLEEPLVTSMFITKSN